MKQHSMPATLIKRWERHGDGRVFCIPHSIAICDWGTGQFPIMALAKEFRHPDGRYVTAVADQYVCSAATSSSLLLNKSRKTLDGFFQGQETQLGRVINWALGSTKLGKGISNADIYEILTSLYYRGSMFRDEKISQTQYPQRLVDLINGHPASQIMDVEVLYITQSGFAQLVLGDSPVIRLSNGFLCPVAPRYALRCVLGSGHRFWSQMQGDDVYRTNYKIAQQSKEIYAYSENIQRVFAYP